MKKFIYILAIIALLIGGYYLYIYWALGNDSEGVPSGDTAKLNIDEVCQSALAYMTFSSGAEAEAFIEACKRGEHPEVIERYKVDMGISDDTAI